MINKIIIENGLKKILADIGKLPEKQMLDLKVILLQEFLVNFEASDFNQAINNMILQEDFYSKLPQTRIFIKYCQKEKDKRLSNLKSQEILEIKEDMENVTTSIIDYLDLKPSDRLYHYVKNELKNENKDKIREVFKKLKDKKDATPDDWRKELNKKEAINNAKNWVIPNLNINPNKKLY
jgi:hypothetical protein